MNITEIRIDDALGNKAFSFSLVDPLAKNSFVLRSVYGLDADEIRHDAVNYNSIYQQTYYDVDASGREIVIRFLVNPDPSLGQSRSQLRDSVYRTVMTFINNKITLVLVDGATDVATIKGQITKVEIPLFSETSEAQITITCPNFLLVSPNYVQFGPFDQPSAYNFLLPAITQGNAPCGWEIEIQNIYPSAGVNFNGCTILFRSGSSTSTWAHLSLSYAPPIEPTWGSYVINFSPDNRLATASSLANGTKNAMHAVSVGSVFPQLLPNHSHRLLTYLWINDAQYSTYHRVTYVRYWPTYWGV